MMPIAIIVISGRASLPRARQRAAELDTYGLEAQVCIGALALRQALQAFRTANEAVAVTVVLDSDLHGNCTNAQLVSALYPECGVVSLLDDFSEASLIMALQSGVDVCYPRDVSAIVLSSVLYSLLRRREVVLAMQAPLASGSYFWQLEQQDWVLEGPKNCALSLTTAERAFLSHLVRQPGMRASHEALMQAVDPDSVSVPSRVAQARLVVLVSRLRSKLQQKHGLELPVKSVHKWGYMFTGEMRP